MKKDQTYLVYPLYIYLYDLFANELSKYSRILFHELKGLQAHRGHL